MTDRVPHHDPNDDLLLIDGDGIPSGLVNVTQLHHRGQQLAYALAAVCDDPDALHETLIGAIGTLSADGWTLVSPYALRSFAEDILLPVLLAARGQGNDLIIGIRAIADALNKENAG